MPKKSKVKVSKEDKVPDGKISKDGVDVEVTVTDKAVGASEAKTPDGQAADGSETPMNAPTPTQIIQTPPKPIVTHESGRDQKVVRHDEQPGSLESTTIVEEVVVHEKEAAKDIDGQIAALRVLAQSQGVNQSIVLGSKTKDGVKGNEVLTVYQDGTHDIQFAPHVDPIDESA